MDANEVEFDPVAAFRPPEAIDSQPRPLRPPLTVPRATWIGARTGFWCVTYVFGPVAVIAVVLALSLTAFGIGFGESWGVLKIIGNGVGAYISLAIWAAIVGGLIGLLAGVVFKALSVARLAFFRRSSAEPRVSPVANPKHGALSGMGAPPRRRRIWPWLVGVPAILAPLLAFVTGLVVPRVVDRRLENAMAAADRDDPNWRLDDLMAHRDRVDDDENSAIVIAGALDLLPNDWPQGEVRKCQERLLTLAANVLLYGMTGERATLTELIRRIGVGEEPISAIADKEMSESSLPQPATPWGKLTFENQRAIGLEWMNEAVAISRRTPVKAARLWKEWDSKLEKARRSRVGILTSWLPLLLMPGLSSHASAQLRYQASLATAAMLLAAERHRRKTGEWPTSFDAISRDLLPTPLVDPHSGEPFRMERRNGRLLIYSIGSNLIDEHGAYEPKRWQERVHDDVGTYGWDVPLRARPAASSQPTPS